MNCVQLRTDASVDLFVADLSAHSQGRYGACLSEEEWERAARYCFTQDRERYVRTHSLLRYMLGEQLEMVPQAIRLENNAWGKPRTLVSPRVWFNISYAGSIALLGFSSRNEIGVDLERLRHIDDASDLAAIHFSAGEQRYLARQRVGAQYDHAFLRGWTRKEACVKAMGRGLSLPTSEFDSGLDDAPRHLRVMIDGRKIELEVYSLDVGPEFVAAWARLL